MIKAVCGSIRSALLTP
ncbi:hypothetical protein L4F31_18680 [Vibrio paracholerae]|nr:hypothetical protein [Vibrio paracholerae]